jgi:iron-sulfur cluster repair protein YtfE (RIC family)
MTSIMRPLLDEHAELRPHLHALVDAAEAVGVVDDEELAMRVAALDAFLHERLLPHAHAEDAVLYPVVEQLLGEGSTATMRRDHVEIARLADELSELGAALDTGAHAAERLGQELRRVLYGLRAVIGLHVAKEEDVYVPVLEVGLTAAEAEQLFHAMHEAALASGPPALHG